MRFLIFKKTIRLDMSNGTQRRGFTLLETIISVALLLVITLFVYQGFMATLQYSSNTALFEKSAQEAAKNVSHDISNSDTAGAVSPDAGLFLTGSYGAGTFSKVLAVSTYDYTSEPVLYPGEAAYNESARHDAANRHGFSYAGRICPVAGCDGELRWYRDGVNVWAFCPVCGYDEKP
jgi:prepilin-type N-terminal cleavage/methylation domain-containing protein